MKRIYLLSLSTLLMGQTIEDITPPSPINTAYETQKQKKILQKQIDRIKKDTTEIEKIKIEQEESKDNPNLGASFVLQGVSIKGNTTFEQKEIAAFVQPYIGKKVYTKTLQEIAKKITNLYHSHRYITSKCILPQQKIHNGNVKFQIIEDKLGSIALSGDNSYEYDAKLFTKYFHNLQGKIINVAQLNEKLKLLKYLPISKISPKLIQVKPGVSNLILKITETKQKISVSLNNMGSEYSGQYHTTITGNLNNIAGISDSLFLAFTTSQTPENYSSLSASYRHPIGKNGSKLTWSASNLNYQLNPSEVGTDTVFYDGSSSQYSVLFEKPLFFFHDINLWFNLGFTHKEMVSRTLVNEDGDTLVHSLDSTSVIKIGTKINFIDKYKGYNSFSFNFAHAIPNLLNSMTQEDIDRKTTRMEMNYVSDEERYAALATTSPLKYGKNLKADFNKYYFSASRQQYLPKEFTMKFSFHGEYTGRRIPQAYEFSTGDYGYSANTGVFHSLGTKILQLGLQYRYTKIYTYDLDLHTTTDTNKSPIINLNLFYKDFYAYLTYQTTLEEWDSNENAFKFNLGYSW